MKESERKKKKASSSQPSKKLTLQEILLDVDSDGMWEYNESVCLAYISGNKL